MALHLFSYLIIGNPKAIIMASAKNNSYLFGRQSKIIFAH